MHNISQSGQSMFGYRPFYAKPRSFLGQDQTQDKEEPLGILKESGTKTAVGLVVVLVNEAFLKEDVVKWIGTIVAGIGLAELIGGVARSI